MRAPLRHLASRPGCQGGFSLIEVLVSLVIFAIGLLGLVGLQALATNYSTDAENAQIAAAQANNLAARMWAANTVQLPTTAINDASTPTSCYSQALKAGLSGPACAVTLDASNTVATITVTWLTPYKQTSDPSKPNYADPNAKDHYSTQVQLP